MKIVLLAVGKRHDSAIAAAIDDYTARLNRYCPATWHMVPSPKAALSADEQKKREAVALMQCIRTDDTVVLLDERGQQWSTRQLAQQIESMRSVSPAQIVCVIGGAHGVGDIVRSRANYTLALSQLTFPHQLVRLILAEQLYRVFSILHNEPYHHD